jgi:hypothetical protein
MEHNLIEAIKGLNEEELILAKEVISGKDELIRHKDVLISELKHQLDNYESNPIRAELIKLLNHDINVKALILDLSGVSDIRTTIENEVDNQCMGLKDEILEDLDYKIDEQFDGNAFKSAVDEYMRRKF